MFDVTAEDDFGPSFETSPVAPPTPPGREGRMIRQPQIERPAAPPQPMPPSMMTALARPGPMPPRGIFSNGDPALGAVPEIPTGHLLGVSLLLPALGTIAGAKFAGGAYGALGGGLLGGSLLNGYRALSNVMQGTADGDKEALISGTYTLIGFAASSYLLYRGITGKGKVRANKKGRSEDDEDDEEEDDDEDDYAANARTVRGVR